MKIIFVSSASTEATLAEFPDDSYTISDSSYLFIKHERIPEPTQPEVFPITLSDELARASWKYITYRFIIRAVFIVYTIHFRKILVSYSGWLGRKGYKKKKGK